MCCGSAARRRFGAADHALGGGGGAGGGRQIKLSDKDAKLITSTKHRLRDCLALHLVSPGGRCCYCMIEIAKWPQMISK